MVKSGKIPLGVMVFLSLGCAMFLGGCDPGAAAIEPERTQEEAPRTVDKNQPDYIQVDIRGTLRHGIVAIGGETTGTTISVRDITWELDLHADESLAKLAELLDGKKVRVRGELERREGVEVPVRWIVRVESLEAAA